MTPETPETTETTELFVDSEKTTIRLRTFAEGLFARLAHDLELTCRDVKGSASRSGDAADAQIEVPIHRIEVAGTLKDGRLHPNGLSPSDREDAEAKMRSDVFHTQDREAVVRVEATLDDVARNNTGKARVKITPPNGKTVERLVNVRVDSGGGDGADGEETRATGSVEVSLSALGSDPVKGPMNAFRVKDNVEVIFDIVFSTKKA